MEINQIVKIEARSKCEHGFEKGFCQVSKCHFSGFKTIYCTCCCTEHTLLFFNSGLDCRAAFPTREMRKEMGIE